MMRATCVRHSLQLRQSFISALYLQMMRFEIKKIQEESKRIIRKMKKKIHRIRKVLAHQVYIRAQPKNMYAACTYDDRRKNYSSSNKSLS